MLWADRWAGPLSHARKRFWTSSITAVGRLTQRIRPMTGLTLCSRILTRPRMNQENEEPGRVDFFFRSLRGQRNELSAE